MVRIEAIFVAGDLFGPNAALDVLHPVVGLLFFNAGLVAMLLAAPKFGLTFGDIGHPRPGGPLETPSPVRRVRAPVVLGLAVAVGLALLNVGFARYETIAGDFGNARLNPFDVRTAQVPGWTRGGDPSIYRWFEWLELEMRRIDVKRSGRAVVFDAANRASEIADWIAIFRLLMLRDSEGWSGPVPAHDVTRPAV